MNIFNVISETKNRIAEMADPTVRIGSLVEAKKYVIATRDAFLSIYRDWYPRRFSYGHTSQELADIVRLKIWIDTASASLIDLYDAFIIEQLAKGGGNKH